MSDDLPEWRTAGLHELDVCSLKQIHEIVNDRIVGAKHSYATVRSWATGRRTSPGLGPMPAPIARTGRSRLWSRVDIEIWAMPLDTLEYLNNEKTSKFHPIESKHGGYRPKATRRRR